MLTLLAIYSLPIVYAFCSVLLAIKTLNYGLKLSCFASAAAVLWFLASNFWQVVVEPSGGATGQALGMLLLPILALLLGLTVGLLTFGLHIMLQSVVVLCNKQASYKTISQLLLALGICLLIAYHLYIELKTKHLAEKAYWNQNPTELTRLYNQLWHGKLLFIDTFHRSLILQELVLNPYVPQAMLYDVYKRGNIRKGEHYSIDMGLAKNIHTPAQILAQLAATSGNSILLSQVANNSNTPVPSLIRLAKSADPKVRTSVIFNANTPLTLLNELAKDRDADVRSTAQFKLKG